LARDKLLALVDEDTAAAAAAASPATRTPPRESSGHCGPVWTPSRHGVYLDDEGIELLLRNDATLVPPS
jgi:hypothetical protein